MSERRIICADGTWKTDGDGAGRSPGWIKVTRIYRLLAEMATAGIRHVYYEKGAGAVFGAERRGTSLGRAIFNSVVDRLADGHSSFRTFHKGVSSIQGDGDRTLRQFKAGSVCSPPKNLLVERFTNWASEKWRSSFLQEFKWRAP